MVSRLLRKRRHTRRNFMIMCGVICFVLIGGYLFVTSTFQLKHFVVEGSTQYTEDEIKDYLVTNQMDQITFMLYFRYKLNTPKSIPFIEKYKVSMEDNHTIKVQVYEKMIVGCVELMGSYMYFDKDGIVVESSKERIDNVPLITGLKFDKIVLNEPLEIQKSSLYEMMLNLTKSIQKFEVEVDQVFINSSYEVILYCGDNEFLLGKKDFYESQISAIPAILKSATETSLSYDMRYYEENDKKITAKPLN